MKQPDILITTVIGDKIVALEEDRETRKKDLILPDSVKKQNFSVGRVIAVGPDVKVVKVGDLIAGPANMFYPYYDGGVTHEKDIFGVAEYREDVEESTETPTA